MGRARAAISLDELVPSPAAVVKEADGVAVVLQEAVQPFSFLRIKPIGEWAQLLQSARPSCEHFDSHPPDIAACCGSLSWQAADCFLS